MEASLPKNWSSCVRKFSTNAIVRNGSYDESSINRRLVIPSVIQRNTYKPGATTGISFFRVQNSGKESLVSKLSILLFDSRLIQIFPKSFIAALIPRKVVLSLLETPGILLLYFSPAISRNVTYNHKVDNTTQHSRFN